MQTLEPPHTHSLSAAEGWVGLGNLVEAAAELDQIPVEFQNLPSVLQVRWAINAAKGDWSAALSTARTLAQTAPGLSAGWLHQAYALRRLAGGGLTAAWDALFPALEMFPGDLLIPYNLACYACQLGRLDEARALLERALKTDRKAVKQIALADSDLKPLWPEIRKL
jgi:tetratricopeptide (TPR) repeat protein